MRQASACLQDVDSTRVRDAARAIVEENLYIVLATVDEQFVLGDGDRRISVSL